MREKKNKNKGGKRRVGSMPPAPSTAQQTSPPTTVKEVTKMASTISDKKAVKAAMKSAVLANEVENKEIAKKARESATRSVENKFRGSLTQAQDTIATLEEKLKNKSKARKFKITDSLEVGEGKLLKAGKQALKKKEKEKAKKKKANAEIKAFRGMLTYVGSTSFSLGMLQDRFGLFSVLPKLIPSAENNELKHEANDDVVIGALCYYGASKAKNIKFRKALMGTCVSALANASRKLGRSAKFLDKTMAELFLKAGLPLTINGAQ